MKTLLLAIAIVAFGLTAQAAVTNVTYRVTVEIAGVGTNQVTTKFQQDGSNKDERTVTGLVWYWINIYKGLNGGTNTFENWAAKEGLKDMVQTYIDLKAESDFAQLAQDVAFVLKKKPDALSASDITAAQAIAAKK